MQALRAILILSLLVYSVFAVSRSISINLVDKFRHLEIYDIVLSLYFPIVLLLIFVLTRTARIGAKTTGGTFFLLTVVTSLFLVIAWYVYDSSNKAPLAVLAGGYFASCGWIYTSRENRNNARKAHTLNILLQMRNSTEFNKHREILIDYLDQDNILTGALIKTAQLKINADAKLSEKNINLSRSARYIANYFEFLCAGYVTGDIDEALLVKTHRSILISYSDWLKEYIEEERLNADGGYNPRLFDNLNAVAAEMRSKLEFEKKWYSRLFVI